MAVWQIFKVNRKTFFNPTAWLDVNSIVAGNRTIRDATEGLFTVPTPDRRETFEAAVKRLNVSEQTLKRNQRNFFWFSVLFFLLGAVILGFSFYLLIVQFAIYGYLIGIPAAGLFFAQAFKYNFWSFQIKERKLGCTFDEWLRGETDKSRRKS